MVEQCECFSPFFTFLNWKRVTYFVVNGGPLNKSAKEFVVSRALMMLIVIEQACTTRLMKLQTRESRRRPSFHLSIHQHSSILSLALYEFYIINLINCHSSNECDVCFPRNRSQMKCNKIRHHFLSDDREKLQKSCHLVRERRDYYYCENCFSSLFLCRRSSFLQLSSQQY